MVNNGQMVNSSRWTDLEKLARETFHNDWKEFLEVYATYLEEKGLSKEVRYEYLRIAKAFLEPLHNVTYTDLEPLKQRIAEFLNIENPNTHRNALASLRHFFNLLGIKDLLKDYKFRSVMPTFSIRTPSIEEVREFGEAIDTPIIKLFYHLGIVSAIRPEHLLKLTKGLFDRRNNMINTWQKTFSQKNFYFSFYSDELKPILESYLDSLPSNDSPLFPFGYRGIQKVFVRAKRKSGINITPKMMRKFSTNWLRRHGMISEDVDAITSHTPRSIVQRHYLDNSRIKEEYDRATKDLILFHEPPELKQLKKEAKDALSPELQKLLEELQNPDQAWTDISKPFPSR